MFPKVAATLLLLIPVAIPGWAQSAAPPGFVCGVKDEDAPAQDGAKVAAPAIARTGARSVLVVRVDFTNAPGAVISETQAITQLGAVDAFFRATSFQQLSLPVVAVTPLLRLPGNAFGYADKITELRDQGRLAAEAAGFPFGSYDFVILSFPVLGAPFTAIAQLNDKVTWVQGNNFTAPILAHELGHNLGLPHANAWFTTDDSIVGPGSLVEYGNQFDLMGNSPFGLSASYNANFSYRLGWLRDADVHVATVSGVYRIFAIDAAQLLDVSKRFALRVPADLTLPGTRCDYWMDARQANAYDRTEHGILIKAASSSPNSLANYLLDTTPGSPAARLDSALVLGRTYADFERGIFITPINRGSKDDNSFFDIEVNIGVTNNQNPTMTISASILATNTSRQVTFSASAHDPDGDELSYFWDFGDETIASKLDKATVSKSWSRPGDYRVQCTASDRKGGFASQSVVMQIGASHNFSVSGQARVGKAPLRGVRVHNGRTGIEYRHALTDSDGSYTITELPAGTHTLQAVKAGLSFTPVTVGVGPSATNIVLTALPTVEPFITAITPDHGEPGTVVTISGVNFSGTAAVRFGEVSAAFVVVSSSKIIATVPAGSFSANLSVTTARGSDTSSQTFTIDVPLPPLITGFAPSHNPPGLSVLISGANFSRATEVRFGGMSAPFYVVSPVQIGAYVPAGASSDTISVITAGGTASSAEIFVVDAAPPPPAPPSIASFTPGHGEPGSIVTMFGTNFSGANAVNFGGVSAAFNVGSSTRLTAIVPTGAFTATLSVTTSNGSAASSSVFVVDPILPHPLAPLISGWNPRHGKPGTPLNIRGTNFSGATAVRFGGVNAAFTMLSPTAITATVPEGAFTAPFSVTTSNGTATSSEAFVLDAPEPVSVIEQPQNLAVAEGSNGVFVVAVSGAGPLGFQWQKEGTNIPGAATSTLAITNAHLESEGRYSVMITNPLGSLVSTTALLTVMTLGSAVEQPALAWSTSVAAPWFGQTNVWLDEGSSGPDGPIDTGGGGGAVRGYSAQSAGHTNTSWIETTVSGPLLLSFWWQLSARFFDETLDFSIDGVRQAQIRGARNWSQYSTPLSNGPHVLRWTRHARQAGTSAWLDQIRTAGNWFTSQPRGTNILAGGVLDLAAAAGPSASFQWERDGFPLADATHSTLHLPVATPADEGDYRVIITYNDISVTSVVAHVTVAPLEISLPPADQNVVATSNVLFRVGFVSQLPAEAQWLYNGQPIPGATNQTLTFRAMPTNAGTYQVMVANGYGILTSAPAELTVDSAPPSILDAGSNYLAYVGEKVILQLPLVAAPPPTYRWLHNRRAIRGATNATLTFPRIRRTQAGDYFLVAQNPFGAVTQRVQVTVRSLVITQQPVSQEVIVEDPLQLSVEARNAAGFGPLKYQWRFNGTPVAGATSRILLIPSAQLHHAGSYDVLVRARLGTRLASSVAAVIVTGSAPVFAIEPQSQSRKVGEATRFSVLAAGRPAPSYQWLFNETPLPNARGATLVIHPVSASSAGTYFVIASNQFGSATSQLAQLLVPEALPQVEIFPGDFAAVAGDFIALREVNGASPPATNYQWTFQAPGLEATNLPGATNSVFILPSITEAQAGKYRIIARNALGEGQSSGTDIAVRPPLALDLWQWISPLPRGDDLLGGTFGHGTYLAVGAAGTAIRAPNTVSWTDQSLRTRAGVPSAGFAADQFMILFADNRLEQNRTDPVLLVSSNALDWLPTALPVVGTIQNLCTANGRFFASGGDPPGGLVICVSEDGSTWNQSAVPLPTNKLSMAYGAGRYVALAGAQVLHSIDATNWDIGPLLEGALDLCFGNGSFVAAGYSGQVWSSTDGLHWTSRASGTGKDLFVAGFGRNRFFVAGEDGKVIISTNGVEWNTVNALTSRELRAFAAGDDQVALFGTGGAIVTSPNGTLWLEHSPAFTTADLVDIVFTNNTFIAVGDSGTVLTSPNGIAWSAQNPGTGKNLNSITPAPNGFVAVGEDGRIFASPNARSWTAQASPETNSLRRVNFLNELYIAVGDNGAIVTSANGTEWFARSIKLAGPGTLEGLAYGNGVFIAVGGFNNLTNGFAASVIVTSPDGVTWTAQTPNFGKKLRNISFVNGQFIGVGNDGLVVHSEDGLSWRRQWLANPLENFRALHALPGLLVIVGNNGVVFSSPDGDTWQRHRSSTAKNLHSVAFGQNKLVAVGSDGAILQSEGILPTLTTLRLPDGAGMQFSIKGGTRNHYRLQVSEDAVSWRDAGIITNGTPAMMGTNDCNSACRFFRLRSL